jgi:hypothetical protein
LRSWNLSMELPKCRINKWSSEWFLRYYCCYPRNRRRKDCDHGIYPWNFRNVESTSDHPNDSCATIAAIQESWLHFF